MGEIARHSDTCLSPQLLGRIRGLQTGKQAGRFGEFPTVSEGRVSHQLGCTRRGLTTTCQGLRGDSSSHQGMFRGTDTFPVGQQLRFSIVCTDSSVPEHCLHLTLLFITFFVMILETDILREKAGFLCRLRNQIFSSVVNTWI